MQALSLGVLAVVGVTLGAAFCASARLTARQHAWRSFSRFPAETQLQAFTRLVGYRCTLRSEPERATPGHLL